MLHQFKSLTNLIHNVYNVCLFIISNWLRSKVDLSLRSSKLKEFFFFHGKKETSVVAKNGKAIGSAVRCILRGPINCSHTITNNKYRPDLIHRI